MTWGRSPSKHRILSLQERAIHITSGVGFSEECRHLFFCRRILTYPSNYALESWCFIRDNIEDYPKRSGFHGHVSRSSGDQRLLVRSILGRKAFSDAEIHNIKRSVRRKSTRRSNNERQSVQPIEDPVEDDEGMYMMMRALLLIKADFKYKGAPKE